MKVLTMFGGYISFSHKVIEPSLQETWFFRDVTVKVYMNLTVAMIYEILYGGGEQ